MTKQPEKRNNRVVWMSQQMAFLLVRITMSLRLVCDYFDSLHKIHLNVGLCLRLTNNVSDFNGGYANPYQLDDNSLTTPCTYSYPTDDSR